MRRLTLLGSLILLVTIGSTSCVEPLRDSVSIETKTWTAGWISTKADDGAMSWERSDKVSIFSVRDGVITHRSDVGVTSLSGGNEKATIVAEIDKNADNYYAFYPSTACSLQIGDTYKFPYIDNTVRLFSRLHDLPQYDEVFYSDKSINFEPIFACFYLYNVDRVTFPLKVKFLRQIEGNWIPVYEYEISKSMPNIDEHLSLQVGLLKYYSFYWAIPEGTYKLKYNWDSVTRICTATLSKGDMLRK